MLSERQGQEIISRLIAARENLDAAIKLSLAGIQPDLVEVSRSMESAVAVGANEGRRRIPFVGRFTERQGGGGFFNAIINPRATKSELTVMIGENRRIASVAERARLGSELQAVALCATLGPGPSDAMGGPSEPAVRSTPFGDRLRRERERRGLTLEEISLSTKIKCEMLQALEQEQFRELPGSFFSKSFLRAYARHVGLDEEETVEDYVATFERKAAPDAPAAPASQSISSLFREKLAALRKMLTPQMVLQIVGLFLIVDLFIVFAWGPSHTWLSLFSPLTRSSQTRADLTSQQLLVGMAVSLVLAFSVVLVRKARLRRTPSGPGIKETEGTVEHEEAWSEPGQPQGHTQ